MDKPQGTAAVLHETRIYEELVEEYGAPAADGLMTKAINDTLPNANITPADVGGFSKVTKALRTGKVDLQSTVDAGQQKARQATEDLLDGLKCREADDGISEEEEETDASS
ncbi:hypothetical protein D3880_11585 [Pseudomonas cavernae]|uniref:Uncharacterized protein n=1 Tax=Pseudomonas cavernae TaxID=2320867 RepID=A0A385Z4V1_9PSED|nr:hypothetical protein [Pseudomonas cavernae]AYC32973.1 hypothetical protein D3880_11585 [Pseudomonas cavernae]